MCRRAARHSLPRAKAAAQIERHKHEKTQGHPQILLSATNRERETGNLPYDARAGEANPNREPTRLLRRYDSIRSAGVQLAPLARIDASRRKRMRGITSFGPRTVSRQPYDQSVRAENPRAHGQIQNPSSRWRPAAVARKSCADPRGSLASLSL